MAGFSVRFENSAAQIDAALWDACFPPPLEGRWWYEALERSGLEDQFEFLHAVIHRDGTPVGIAPMFAMKFPLALVAPPALAGVIGAVGKVLPSLSHPRTLFVGSPCADEGTVGLLDGTQFADALPALIAAFNAKARELGAGLVVWKDFAQAQSAVLGSPGFRDSLFAVTSFPGTLVDLPPGGRDAYFAAMKGSRRHVLKKKLRRSAGLVALDTEVLQSPDAAALDELFGLFWQTYEKATTRFEKLNREFLARLAVLPVTHCVVLRERPTRRAVAFMLCFVLGTRVINKFIGIDYARPKEWLLYFRLWDAAVDFALARGATSIQSGQTGYAPKIETGHRLVPLTNYCTHKNRIVDAVLRIIARRIDWATLDDDLERYLIAHPEAAPPTITK